MPKPSPEDRDLYPGARITIETSPPRYRRSAEGGVAGGSSYTLERRGEYLTFEDFTSVSTVQSLSGAPTATITLASHRDYWHRKARLRQRTTRRQQEISEYLGDVLSLVTMVESDPRRRELKQESIRFLGVPVKNLGRRLEAFLTNLYVSERDNGETVASAPPRSRLDEYQSYEWYMADMEEMRRVWIDFRDRQGRWVAAFTGIISDLTDSVTAGQPPMVTLQCSGMLRFWEMSEYITRQALKNLEWPFKGGAREFKQSTLSNSLAKYDVPGMMVEMARSVNEWFTFTGDPDGSADRHPDDFFHHAPLLQFSSDPAKNATFGNGGSYLNPVREAPPGSEGAETTGRLIIDPEAVRTENRRGEVYRRAIRQVFDLYRFENSTPARVAADAAAITLFDFFEDPKGNILLWVPKYDALPRIRGEISVPPEDRKLLSTTDAGPDFVSPFAPGLTAPPGNDPVAAALNVAGPMTTRYGEDYSVVPYHDSTYIIDAVGHISTVFTRSEKLIKTFVRSSSQPHIVVLGETISAVSNTGYTSFEEVTKISPEIARAIVKLNRRYGVRRHTTPAITTKSVGGETDLLVRYAISVLTRLNAYARAGSSTLNQRPELWPGRSIFHAERQKVAYITRAQNTLNWRQPHQTTLTYAYVHDPSERIGQPWFARTDEAPLAGAGDATGVLG